jgi:hypothetical protein
MKIVVLSPPILIGDPIAQGDLLIGVKFKTRPRPESSNEAVNKISEAPPSGVTKRLRSDRGEDPLEVRQHLFACGRGGAGQTEAQFDPDRIGRQRAAKGTVPNIHCHVSFLEKPSRCRCVRVLDLDPTGDRPREPLYSRLASFVTTMRFWRSGGISYS